eukprot:1332776-Prymnesium_polylepis.1
MPRRPTAAPPTVPTRRSSGDSQKMGESAGTGGGAALPIGIARDLPSSSPSHEVAHSGRRVSLQRPTHKTH